MTARRLAAAYHETPPPQDAGPGHGRRRAVVPHVSCDNSVVDESSGVVSPRPSVHMRPPLPVPPSLCLRLCAAVSPRRRVLGPHRALTSPTLRPLNLLFLSSRHHFPAPRLLCARVPLRLCSPAPVLPKLPSSPVAVSRNDRGRPPRQTFPQCSSSTAIIPRGIRSPRQSSLAAIVILPAADVPAVVVAVPCGGPDPLPRRSSPVAVVVVPHPRRQMSPWWSWLLLRWSFAAAVVSAMIAVVIRGGPPPALVMPTADLPAAVIVVSPRSHSSAAPAVSARPARARWPPTRPSELTDSVGQRGETRVEGGGGAR